MKDCQAGCGREVTKPYPHRYCDLCRAADPHRHRSRQAKTPQEFVSVDGEGRQEGRDMSMVTMSYGREDGSSGSVEESDGRVILRWLAGELSPQHEGHRQVPVAFHFGWDSSVLAKSFDDREMMLIHKAGARNTGQLCDTARCDHSRCGRLPRRSARLIQAVITDGGEGDLLAWDPESQMALALTPRRRLYAEHRPHGDRYEGWRRLDIHDTGAAFGGGLLAVLDAWSPASTPGQRAIIERGKRDRENGFAGWSTADIKFYSETECVLHARTCRMLLDAVRDAAHIPMQPKDLFGSGSIAAAAMKYHKVPRRKLMQQDDTPVAGVPLDDLARLTYFGGMIEAPVVGLVTGLVDEVDLNAAYPSAEVDLPCMKAGHGHWQHARSGGGAPAGAMGHVLATWSVKTPSTPPFTVRDVRGRVFQPLSGYRTWVTLAEYQAALEHFGPAVSSTKAVWWVRDCDCGLPFAWMRELYDERHRIKGRMRELAPRSPQWQKLNVLQNAIKLILNSCYGKLAQLRPCAGPYTNLHWASHITGVTRARLRRETWAREDQGGTVVYQHTDSVQSRGGSPEDGGTALGAWGLEKQALDKLILQPGLTVALGGGKGASRGVGKDEFEKAARAWADSTDFSQHPFEWPALEIPVKRMVSRRMAISRGKPHLAGSFETGTMKVHVPSGKRAFYEAAPLPGTRAWAVPPIDFVDEQATLETLREYQTMLAKVIKEGKFDL